MILHERYRDQKIRKNLYSCKKIDDSIYKHGK